jgi:glutamine amidotransferase
LISNLKKLKIYKSLKTYLENNFSYLGICVGMQILSDVGYEEKTTKGLGIIQGEIKKFEKKNLIIPHMGWNSLQINNEDKILTPAFHEKDFYFVHSYIFERVKKSDVLATTKYGKNFPSVVKKGNVYGVQFHPEKSHKNGLKLIKNFILNS